ncbi:MULTISPECIES: NAD(P)-dependent oxidoreductase [unclassified Arthrobacter]|uniref:NAD(P)-dependent oxidoreductase n=1 Tax=unclassified Arthrobacter TaxID=235627 RepID=UPI002103FE0B|nr:MULTISPECIES: NAD(P)-binding oxidoreductase [unclassified Arthrobacter]MCQ1945502.1 SDR family oxidoreductase [Arthrobacter sp. zg-Y1116]MCQ1994837.1 SDR family oxidoreductase [Arthrobacter sp. zg-Y1171]UWX81096.1 SDR family oxidoreductase [Arthrobacter sp. zg-Y1171]
MKITVIGGSQGTGAQLASLAQAAGHEVTVLSRSGRAPAGVLALTGDATDPEAVSAAVSGADAVVVTVGGAKGVHHQRGAVTRTVIDAMRAEGVRRLVVQSSLGAGDSASQLPGPLGLITRIVLAKALADHNAQESAVQSSGLDWTILRPTGLTDKEPSGTWRMLETTDNGKLKGSIPRADLAACMLSLLTDESAVGRALGVSS